MEVNGTIQLQRSHAYYYQVQTQMDVCQVKYCDFVVWEPSLLQMKRIKWDEDLCANIFSISRRFFVSAVLPELYAKYSTRQNSVGTNALCQKPYCFCNGAEKGKMVACDNEACTYTWFYFSCVRLTRAPKTKQWYCP